MFKNKTLVRSFKISNFNYHASFNVYNIKLFIHLYVGIFGIRSYEIIGPYNGSIDRDRINEQVTCSEFFQEEIYPWLKGRNTASIPSVKEAKKSDFKKDRFIDTLKE